MMLSKCLLPDVRWCRTMSVICCHDFKERSCWAVGHGGCKGWNPLSWSVGGYTGNIYRKGEGGRLLADKRGILISPPPQKIWYSLSLFTWHALLFMDLSRSVQRDSKRSSARHDDCCWAFSVIKIWFQTIISRFCRNFWKTRKSLVIHGLPRC